MNTPCECPDEGFCERHGIEKPGRLHYLCQNRQDYFDLWEQGRGPGQSAGTRPVGVCVHRGKKLRHEICQVGCKSLRGRKVPIHECGMHGECSVRKYAVGQPIQCCLSCDDFRRQSKIDRMLPIESMSGVAVGVTTCQRSSMYLTDTCASILACGAVPSIFAEPGTDLEEVAGLPVFVNETLMGPWRNWLLTARVLLDSDCETIVIVQDDTIFEPCAFEVMQKWIDETKWNYGNAGMFGLYTSRKYHKEEFGAHKVNTVSLWGACALAFPRDILEHAIDTAMARNWMGAPFKSHRGTKKKTVRPPEKIGNIDTIIGKIMRKMGLEMWFHSPSLSQHVGDVSAMNHGKAKGNRVAKEVIQC